MVKKSIPKWWVLINPFFGKKSLSGKGGELDPPSKQRDSVRVEQRRTTHKHTPICLSVFQIPKTLQDLPVLPVSILLWLMLSSILLHLLPFFPLIGSRDEQEPCWVPLAAPLFVPQHCSPWGAGAPAANRRAAFHSHGGRRHQGGQPPCTGSLASLQVC